MYGFSILFEISFKCRLVYLQNRHQKMASFVYWHTIEVQDKISYPFIRYLGYTCQGYLKTIIIDLIIFDLKNNLTYGF